MAETCLEFSKQETERLEMEIETLQEGIRLHSETKDAWDAILRNTGDDLNAVQLDLATTEKERLNGKITAVQEEIRRHIETRVAWDTIVHNSGKKSRIYKDVTYVSGENAQWHLERLEMEIDALQQEIHLHDETREAWNTVVRGAGSKPDAAFLESVHSELKLLNGKIAAVQEKIRRHIETKDAWVTIMRNAGSPTHIYQGATYVRGLDGQWHLQQVDAAPAPEKDESNLAEETASKVYSMRDRLMDACEKTFFKPQKQIPLVAQNEQFQSLGLQ
jgi:hypothetical protein